MAATARERDDAIGGIEQSIQGVKTAIAGMDRSPEETNAWEIDFMRPVDVRSKHLRVFDQLVGDQPLYRSQMSWRVALQDMLPATGRSVSANSWSPSALSTSTSEQVSGIKSASRRNWLAGPAG